MIALDNLNMRTVPGELLDERSGALPSSDSALAQALPENARLLDYDLISPIGEGGFGIVYLAWDRVHERHVAVKEYLPATLARRAATSRTVVPRSAELAQAYRTGLHNFVQGARLLARFDHPALVKVLHCWKDNGSAYMAMPYHPDPPLERVLAELGRVPNEAELRAMLEPLLDALALLHAANCVHGDIAPDNILITDSGPLLLDFGAARRVVGPQARSARKPLKPGYAPIEQYGDAAAEGAWTDLYALGCVVYRAIAGRPPPPASERRDADTLVALSELARDRYGAPFLAAIDRALALQPQDRTRSAAEMRAAIAGQPEERAGLAQIAEAASPPPQSESTRPADVAEPVSTALLTRVEENSRTADGGATRALAPPEPEPAVAAERTPATAAPTTAYPLPASAPMHAAPRGRRLALLGLAGAAVLAAMLYGLLQRQEVAPPSPRPPPMAAHPQPSEVPSAQPPQLPQAPQEPSAPATPSQSPDRAGELPASTAAPAPATAAPSANTAALPRAAAPAAEAASAAQEESAAQPVSAPSDPAAAATPGAAGRGRDRPSKPAPVARTRAPVSAVDRPDAVADPSVVQARRSRAVCRDLLQRASLGTLLPKELDQMKKECK